jgi:hypothetical protein
MALAVPAMALPLAGAAARPLQAVTKRPAGPLALAATGKHHSFPDVPADHWAAQAVQLVADLGIMIGYPDGTFNGGQAR